MISPPAASDTGQEVAVAEDLGPAELQRRVLREVEGEDPMEAAPGTREPNL